MSTFPIFSNHFPLDNLLNSKKNKTIYVLELQNGKYYVGKKTSQNDNRFLEHFGLTKSLENNKVTWTKKYNVIRIAHQFYNCNDFDEDVYTKMFMCIYGIDNVRGGSYSSPFICTYERDNLNKILPKNYNSLESFKENKIIYYLKLSLGRYFIVQLNNNENILTYIQNNTSEWFIKYPFEKILGSKIHSNCLEVDKYVVMAICKIGFTFCDTVDEAIQLGSLYVRGGNFSSIDMSYLEYMTLRNYAMTALDICYNCKKIGHFAKNCATFKCNISKRIKIQTLDMLFKQKKNKK